MMGGVRGLVVLVLIAGCYGDGVTHCDTYDCPSDSKCDGHGGCATLEQLGACIDHADLDTCSYTGVPVGECHDGACRPFYCGDGTINPPFEVCDDGDHNAAAPDKCRPNCQLPRCGDGIV